MSILNTVVTLYSRFRLQKIDWFRKHPEKAQYVVFKNLIKKAKRTAWGKLYNYTSIESISDFQKSVPLQEYDDIKPWLERIKQGERDVLWKGAVRWFAKSSGTTSDKSKFIPITKDSLKECHFRGGKDVLSIYRQNYPETKILRGKTLTLGGSTKIDCNRKKSFDGDLSAILITKAPFWTSFARVPNIEIALIDDFEDKISKITASTINENIVSIAGVPSWNLFLIREVLKATGKNNLLEVWPNIELFIHGGVSFTPYHDTYKELIPSEQMHYMETYNASEGFFALQDNPSTDDMLLMLDYGIFYEFIPLDQLENTSFIPLTVGEVKTNTPYAIVISTSGGLWRYIIGDVVEFTSLRPHKIKITGRTKQYINAFGEELMSHNAIEALKAASEKTNAKIKEFTAAPIFMNNNNKARHQWLIEFDVAPDNIDLFTETLDNSLKSLNSDYEAKRFKNSILDIPQIIIARKYLFYDWMKKRGKLGGQNKVPQLSNNRQFIDDLLAMNM